MNRTGAAEREQRIATHVAAVFHRVDLGRCGHVLAHDAMDAAGRLDHGKPKRPRYVLLDDACSEVGTHAHRTAQVAFRVEVPQDKRRIGHGR